MIVVDTSAIVSILLEEPTSSRIHDHLATSQPVMSAPTRVELGIVVESRNGPAGVQLLEELINRIGVEVVPFDEELARDALVAWRRFGKGRHRAGLNLGDTYSYALARRLNCPLLFVGDDFSHTDITAALE